MLLSALLTILLIPIVACHKVEECPRIIPKGKTCWAYDAARKEGFIYYGDDVKYHAWHVTRSQYNKIGFSLRESGESSKRRRELMKDLGSAGSGRVHDEKPLGSMDYDGDPSICNLPQDESDIELQLSKMAVSKVRPNGGILYLVDNHSPAGALTREPKCETPAGLAKPTVSYRPGTPDSGLSTESETDARLAALHKARNSSPSPRRKSSHRKRDSGHVDTLRRLILKRELLAILETSELDKRAPGRTAQSFDEYF